MRCPHGPSIEMTFAYIRLACFKSNRISLAEKLRFLLWNSLRRPFDIGVILRRLSAFEHAVIPHDADAAQPGPFL